MTPINHNISPSSSQRTSRGGPPTTPTNTNSSSLVSEFSDSKDTVHFNFENSLGDLNKIISKNQALRNSSMLFGGPKKKKGKVRKAFDWYVKNVDVPGPYGSPIPEDWPKRKDAFNVGKWNDQVNYVSKNGTTAEKIIQRGALATGVAATSAAVVTGAAELRLGKQIIIDGPKARGGRIFQLRPKGESGFFRLDFHPLGKHSPKGLEGFKLPHYHRTPNMSLHRPFQGW